MDSPRLRGCALCAKRVAITREELLYGETDIALLCRSCMELALRKTAQKAGPPVRLYPILTIAPDVGPGPAFLFPAHQSVNRKVVAPPGIAREVFTASSPVYSSSLCYETG